MKITARMRFLLLIESGYGEVKGEKIPCPELSFYSTLDSFVGGTMEVASSVVYYRMKADGDDNSDESHKQLYYAANEAFRHGTFDAFAAENGILKDD